MLQTQECPEGKLMGGSLRPSKKNLKISLTFPHRIIHGIDKRLEQVLKHGSVTSMDIRNYLHARE